MSKIDIAKKIIGGVVSLGVGNIIGNAIRSTTPADVKRHSKILISIGGVAIGGLVTEQAVKYTEAAVDEAVAGFNHAFNGVVVVQESEPTEAPDVDDAHDDTK